MIDAVVGWLRRWSWIGLVSVAAAFLAPPSRPVAASCVPSFCVNPARMRGHPDGTLHFYGRLEPTAMQIGFMGGIEATDCFSGPWASGGLIWRVEEARAAADGSLAVTTVDVSGGREVGRSWIDLGLQRVTFPDLTLVLARDGTLSGSGTAHIEGTLGDAGPAVEVPVTFEGRIYIECRPGQSEAAVQVAGGSYLRLPCNEVAPRRQPPCDDQSGCG